MPFKALYQSLRFYQVSTGFDKFTAFEKLGSLQHAATLLPGDKLSMFQLELPLSMVTIAEWKLKCYNGTTKFDCKTKLTDSTDLKLRTFRDQSGNLKQQLIYTPLSGFQVAGNPVVVENGSCYMYLKITDSVGVHYEYQSNLIEIFTADVSRTISDLIDEGIGM